MSKILGFSPLSVKTRGYISFRISIHSEIISSLVNADYTISMYETISPPNYESATALYQSPGSQSNDIKYIDR